MLFVALALFAMVVAFGGALSNFYAAFLPAVQGFLVNL